MRLPLKTPASALGVARTQFAHRASPCTVERKFVPRKEAALLALDVVIDAVKLMGLVALVSKRQLTVIGFQIRAAVEYFLAVRSENRDRVSRLVVIVHVSHCYLLRLDFPFGGSKMLATPCSASSSSLSSGSEGGCVRPPSGSAG